MNWKNQKNNITGRNTCRVNLVVKNNFVLQQLKYLLIHYRHSQARRQFHILTRRLLPLKHGWNVSS
jgi:hypothetical protein